MIYYYRNGNYYQCCDFLTLILFIILVPKCQKYSNGVQQGTSEAGHLVVYSIIQENLLNAKQVFLQIWLSHGFYCYLLSSTGIGGDAALHPCHLLVSGLHQEPK